jgi:superfamily II DNA or RNA helicase
MTETPSPIEAPVEGCWVVLRGSATVGVVRGSELRDNRVHVEWNDGTRSWTPLGELCSGLSQGMRVQEIPRSAARSSLGVGYVEGIRAVGGRDLVTVDFPETGDLRRVPFENLRALRDPRVIFNLDQPPGNGSAERMRLRALAHALELWNKNTGSLSRLDIDPLPHQINLVHHIVASGSLNWLIADDVGLGKTIELGMLLAALRHRGLARRVLIATPAGLVRQWQEELYHRFGMDDFQIYGEDFHIRHPRQWRMYEHVIGSVDRFKSAENLDSLMGAGTWDLVVFDEAHRLSRRAYGLKYEVTQRYRLAATLRSKTAAMILLSGTPHQGMSDKFKALLELLRPDLKDEIHEIEMGPSLLREMVIRNHKADVTDQEGRLLFNGRDTHGIPVEHSQQELAFDKALSHYVREGYVTAGQSGTTGRAVGFVMTVYRKLAASSIAAIHAALLRRQKRLEGEAESSQRSEDEGPPDERFTGEFEEEISTPTSEEFFSGELELLQSLVSQAGELAGKDEKLRTFQEELLPQVLRGNPDEKVLVFTEYRATQEHLAESITDRFGKGSVVQINGSMDYEQRTAAISAFEDTAQFLISTEAGGEGINLHRRCHVLINYDMPWNPMRLVQRVGRLYRYGQKERVVVFNLQRKGTFDADIIDLLYSRIDAVVDDLAPVDREFRPGLREEIVGEVTDVLDVEQIMERAATDGLSRTKEVLEGALSQAKLAVEKQRQLFEYATETSGGVTEGALAIGTEHLDAFVRGMVKELGIEVRQTLYDGRVMELLLPEALGDSLGMRRVRRVTSDREIASTRPNVEMLDLESPLLRHFVQQARRGTFGGECAALGDLDGAAVVGAILRWQNDQGQRLNEEYCVAQVGSDGAVNMNPDTFCQWLAAGSAEDGSVWGEKTTRVSSLRAAIAAFEERGVAGARPGSHPAPLEVVHAGVGSE